MYAVYNDKDSKEDFNQWMKCLDIQRDVDNVFDAYYDASKDFTAHTYH